MGVIQTPYESWPAKSKELLCELVKFTHMLLLKLEHDSDQ